MKMIRTAFAISLVLTYGACGGKGSGPSASGDANSQRRSNTETYEDSFRIGKKAASDGTVTSETDKFTAGEPIYISFVIRNAPADASAKVLWKRIDGNVRMGEEQKPLSSSGFVSFAVKDTSAWPPGRYRLEKSFGRETSSGTPIPWKGIGTKDLTISPR